MFVKAESFFFPQLNSIWIETWLWFVLNYCLFALDQNFSVIYFYEIHFVALD